MGSVNTWHMDMQGEVERDLSLGNIRQTVWHCARRARLAHQRFESRFPSEGSSLRAGLGEALDACGATSNVFQDKETHSFGDL